MLEALEAFEAARRVGQGKAPADAYDADEFHDFYDAEHGGLWDRPIGRSSEGAKASEGATVSSPVKFSSKPPERLGLVQLASPTPYTPSYNDDDDGGGGSCDGGGGGGGGGGPGARASPGARAATPFGVDEHVFYWLAAGHLTLP